MKKQVKTVSKTAKIRALLEAGNDVKTVVKKLKVKPAAVYQVRWRMAKDEKANDEKIFAEMDAIAAKVVARVVEESEKHDAADHPVHYDPVNHPPHYKAGGIETIDFIEAKQFGYHLGNVVKYISRAYHKGGMEDLLKAQWYLNRAIEKGEV